MADIGVIGLGVMAQNLILNMIDKGFSVAVYNRTASKVKDFTKNNPSKQLIGFESLKEMVQQLPRPRKILMMVSSQAVGDVIEEIVPLLEKEDVLIDGGNSYFEDTNRRCKYLQEKGISFVGMGISGGEKGAREGPSIMPGGNEQAWERIAPIFQKIAAQEEDKPCCEWIGPGGSGHYVKMIHNGIEYAIMQLIAEGYDLQKKLLGAGNEKIASVFKYINQFSIKSYLLEIARSILLKIDDDGQPLIDKVLDVASQKGTGQWTVQDALSLQAESFLTADAVFMRNFSHRKEDRLLASKKIKSPKMKMVISDLKEELKNAYYLAIAVAFSQGFYQIRKACVAYSWQIDLSLLCRIWKKGCIIQMAMLDDLQKGLIENEEILLSSLFIEKINSLQFHLRKIVLTAVENGVAVMGFSSALTYLDAFREEKLPMHIIQALRDCFGAHMFEREDSPIGKKFHVDWEER